MDGKRPRVHGRSRNVFGLCGVHDCASVPLHVDQRDTLMSQDPPMTGGAPPRTERVLGRYKLFDEIAAGGMATVHLARMLGPVGFSKTVAIKRLHPNLARDPEFVTMFLDEARLAARIHHPNVVSTLDVV